MQCARRVSSPFVRIRSVSPLAMAIRTSYVKNQSTCKVDYLGLQAASPKPYPFAGSSPSRGPLITGAATRPVPAGVGGTNETYGLLGDILFAVGASPTNLKNTILLSKGKSLPTVKRPLRPDMSVGVGQGKYTVFSVIPNGTSVGTTGAGPCIGVIIRYPTGKTFVYHFQGGDHPARTFVNTRPVAPPPGTTALVFGGNNSPSSNFLLGSVVGYLDSNGVLWGYSDTTGGNVDGKGQYFLYPNDDMRP